MKKIVFAIAALAMINSVNVQAQDILGTLKNAAATAASKSDNSTVAAIGNLLGTSSVSAADLVGTWNYSQPAVAFESKNVLTNVGTAAASSAIEKKLATYLTKYNSFKMNVKKSGSELQVAMKADKLMSLLQGIISAAGKSDTSSLSSIASLTKSIDGMYLGLKFTK